MDESKLYALVHLDADLYAPTLAGCEYFYPKLSKGGAMIIHDGFTVYKGSRLAVDDFFKDKPEVPILIPDVGGSMIIIKI